MPPNLYEYLMDMLGDQDPQSGAREPFCSCGAKGHHPQTDRCPQEGASYLNPVIYDVAFDPTVLTYRYEDDPVGMALVEAHERLIADSRALYIAHLLTHTNQNERINDLTATVAAEKKRASSAVDNYNQMSVQFQSAVKARDDLVLENRALKQRLEESTRRWRAIVEEVAIHIGLVKPGQPWTPGSLLRDMEIMEVKNSGQDRDRGADPAPGDGQGLLHAGEARPQGDVPVPGPREGDPRWSIWRHRRSGVSGEG